GCLRNRHNQRRRENDCCRNRTAWPDDLASTRPVFSRTYRRDEIATKRHSAAAAATKLRIRLPRAFSRQPSAISLAFSNQLLVGSIHSPVILELVLPT